MKHVFLSLLTCCMLSAGLVGAEGAAVATAAGLAHISIPAGSTAEAVALHGLELTSKSSATPLLLLITTFQSADGKETLVNCRTQGIASLDGNRIAITTKEVTAVSTDGIFSDFPFTAYAIDTGDHKQALSTEFTSRADKVALLHTAAPQSGNKATDEYYQKIVNEINPTYEIQAGRKLTLVLTKGLEIPISYVRIPTAENPAK